MRWFGGAVALLVALVTASLIAAAVWVTVIGDIADLVDTVGPAGVIAVLVVPLLIAISALRS